MRVIFTVFLSSFLLLSGCNTATDNSNQTLSLERAQANFKAQKYDVAYRELLPLAAKGNTDAQYAVGYMYYYGKGVDKNTQLAKHWLMRAAKQGNEAAREALDRLG